MLNKKRADELVFYLKIFVFLTLIFLQVSYPINKTVPAVLFIELAGKYYPNNYIYKVYKNKWHDHKFIRSPLSF